MSRSGKISPTVYILAIPALVIAFAVGVLLMRRSPVGEGEPFPYATYMRDAESLRGNTYLLSGQIDSRVFYAEGKAGLYVVKLLDGSGGRLPVYVPERVQRNIDVGQRFDFRVTLRRDRIEAEAMAKP